MKQSIALLSLTLASGIANAETIRIREREVIPVVIEDTLKVRDTRNGETFYARVADSRDLPYGTRLQGRVIRIEKSRNGRPATIDLEFRTLILPNGSRERIEAVPVSLDARGITRNRDGRLEVKKSDRDREKTVLGGVLGGLALGSLIKKPFEGAFVGAIAGIIIAESTSRENDGTFIRKGAKYGAMFERSVSFDYDGRWDRDDRYDDRYRDDDRYDDRDRDRDRDWEDRYADRDASNRYGETCVFRYEDRRLRYSANTEPFRAGDSWMVPLEQTASQLGLSSDFDERGNRWFVEDEDNTAIVELGTKNYRINGKKREFLRNPERRNGVLYVSVEFFADLKGKSFSIEDRTTNKPNN